MRKGKEEDSSLELLLDTMCNTFGGVMFIAISLAVIVAGRNAVQKVSQVPEESCLEDVQKIREEITALEIALSRSTAQQRDWERLRQLMEQDDRLKLLGEIALLEEKTKNLDLQKKIRVQKIKASETAKLGLLIEIEKLKKQLGELSSVKQKKAQELSDVKEQTEKLKREINRTAPKELTFHVLTERQETPYFIALHGNSFWRIGPQKNSGGEWIGEDDMDTQSSSRGMLFSAKPERGRAFRTPRGITPELLQLLTQLPKDRIPKFVIDKSAVPEFFALRQELKKRGIRHGFSVAEDSRTYYIRLVQRAKYEY